MAFGTLRRDSFFSPGEVLEEARALDAAVRALGRVVFEHAELGTIDADFLAGYNAFILVWRDFWAEANGWSGWIFRAKDATRDELLGLEDQYAALKNNAGARIGRASPSDADATDGLPDPTPEGQRTEDNLDHALEEGSSILQKAGFGLVGTATIVVVGVVVLLAVARRGGVPIPGAV